MNSAQGSEEVRSAAAISAGYAGATVLGGVLALLIANFFGKSTETDAFFAAYGLYWVALVFAHTIRLAAVPQLLATEERRGAERLIAAVLGLGLIALIPMVALSEPIGGLLVVTDPTGTAPESLRMLWPALAAQLLAGALAAILAVRGRFLAIGLAYIASGFVSIGAFLALRQAADIQAVSLALSISGAFLATTLTACLLATGWRPRPPFRVRLRPLLSEVKLLLLASASFAATNLGFVVCLAVAAREGTGKATIYAYAYFAAALLVSMTAVSAALVRSAKALASSEDAELSWANSLSTYRFALLLVLPVLALAALVGKPVVEVLLGDDFTGADATRLIVTLLSLSGWIVGSAAGVLATMLLLGKRRYWLVATISMGQLAVLLPLALVGREVAGVPGIAAAQSVAMLIGTVPLLVAAFGIESKLLLRGLATATFRGTACVGLAVAPAFVVLAEFGRSTELMIAATVGAALLLVAATIIGWPQESRVLLGAISQRFHIGRESLRSVP
jgi:peptidoglycan biosynthesis protein MviN/MurJ (putative lipid II flippase)